MRTGIVVETGAADRTRMEMIVADRGPAEARSTGRGVLLTVVVSACGRREEAVARAAVPPPEGFGHAWRPP